MATRQVLRTFIPGQYLVTGQAIASNQLNPTGDLSVEYDPHETSDRQLITGENQ